MSEDFRVCYDYSDVPTLKKFALSNARFRMAMGPFGCLSGDVKIVTERGLVPIADIREPIRVLSWNENSQKFVLSPASISYPKGTDYLYRVLTGQGEFVAAGHHRVFCADHKYRQVQNLQVGDALSICCDGRLLKSVFDDSLLYGEDARHYSKKDVGSLANYAGSIHPCDQLPHWATGIFPTLIPSLADAHKLSFLNDWRFDEHRDGFWGRLLEHIHPDQCASRKQTDDYSPRAGHRNEVSRGYAFSQSFSRIAERVRQSLPPLPKNVDHYIKKLLAQSFRSFASSSVSDRNILSIERLSVKQQYWDLHVFGTNNYVTEDGTIHHNSGKSSACVMEIIRRAHEQKPGPDGVRRSRWAVVRNSYRQLSDTTIKTFHDWFPPKLFGEWRVTDHTFIITKFPNVHLEVLFRALDRPDQVSNLLSLELTGAWFNEVREIPRTIIEAMDARIGRFPSLRDGGPSWHGTIMDTNPPDEDSYLYKMFEKVRPDGWEIFKQPSGLSAHAENTKHLVKNYYQNLAKGKDEMYIRVYIHGQYGYIISGKPVFQSFVDNVHVAPHILEPQKGLDVLVGLDFGLSPAITIGQITPLGQLRILDELVSDGMGLRQFCENQVLPLLRRKYFGMNVVGFGDPSGVSRSPTDESTCYEVLHGPDVGLRNVLPAPTNAIMPRISAVEGFLNKMNQGEPGFLLSPNCHFLRKAMNGGYHYEKDTRATGSDEYKPMPAKNFSSHIADSLEYLCLYIAEKEVRDKRWKNIRIPRRQYRPASSEAGY